MRTSDFNYELPQTLIAQTPARVRSSSRLLVLDRSGGGVSDRVFSDLTDYLRPGDVLVRNTTRVLPARLNAVREETGGAMEFLLLKRLAGDEWECLARPAKRARAGRTFRVNDELSVRVLSETDAAGGRRIELLYSGIFEQVLERAGSVPLPPYITQRLDEKERYQTVYARENGSAAAPTAGLHFTDRLFDEIRQMGVSVEDVLLHVGLGTFRPVTVDQVEAHHMHAEFCQINADTAERINAARARGGRVIAVGTTSVRTLETATDDGGRVRAFTGETSIFITPGYRFKAVDALITNFHLPESTLLMLVSAFAGREQTMAAYRHAVEEQYRFFSFGDAMLVI